MNAQRASNRDSVRVKGDPVCSKCGAHVLPYEVDRGHPYKTEGGKVEWCDPRETFGVVECLRCGVSFVPGDGRTCDCRTEDL